MYMTATEYIQKYHQGYRWDLDPDDPMVIVIRKDDVVVMRIFLGEAMEGAGKFRVMKHVEECNRSPWIDSWHNGTKADTWQILNRD